MFDERRHVLRTVRLWAVVFTSNLAVALFFALLAAKSCALRPEVLNELVRWEAKLLLAPRRTFSGAGLSADD